MAARGGACCSAARGPGGCSPVVPSVLLAMTMMAPDGVATLASGGASLVMRATTDHATHACAWQWLRRPASGPGDDVGHRPARCWRGCGAARWLGAGLRPPVVKMEARASTVAAVSTADPGCGCSSATCGGAVVAQLRVARVSLATPRWHGWCRPACSIDAMVPWMAVRCHPCGADPVEMEAAETSGRHEVLRGSRHGGDGWDSEVPRAVVVGCAW